MVLMILDKLISQLDIDLKEIHLGCDLVCTRSCGDCKQFQEIGTKRLFSLARIFCHYYYDFRLLGCLYGWDSGRNFHLFLHPSISTEVCLRLQVTGWQEVIHNIPSLAELQNYCNCKNEWRKFWRYSCCWQLNLAMQVNWHAFPDSLQN